MTNGVSSPPRRVVVTGSESTGKTTMAAQLAQSLQTVWVPEFSRRYAESVGRPLSAYDVEPIAHGQLAEEESAVAAWRSAFARASQAPPLVLDTDLVSTTVYAEHYYGACPAWIATAARERLGALYLLCEPDLPWEADGIRDQPAARAALHRAFVDRLREYGARVVPIVGVGPERLQSALGAVREQGDA
jgi:NadR type nicotinamide-nucleotide adenylyltransferase